MKLSRLILLNISIFMLFAQGISAQTSSRPRIINNNQNSSTQSTSLSQKLTSWGFENTVCGFGTARIKDLVTKEEVCVKSTSELNPGNYVYDPDNHQIQPAQYSSNNSSSPPPSVETTSVGNHINPTPATNDPRIADVVFAFGNVYDYNNCLDALLLLYEGRNPITGPNSCLNNIVEALGYQINRDLMLELVDLANFRATNLLPKKVYPAYGIRRRIAVSVGYLYEIDLENAEMIEYAAVAGQSQ